MVLVGILVLASAGCSSDSDSGRDGNAEGRDRTTTSTTAEDESTTTTTDADAAPTTSSAPEPATTTTSDPEPATTTTGALGAATTTTTTAPTATTTAPGPGPGPGAPAPQDYSGVLDGQPADVTVGFVRSGSVTDFQVRGLEIECQPLAIDGEPMSRTVSVSIAEAPIAADASVAFTDESQRLKPSLSGSFAVDGTFAGSIFLSGEDKGFVCGGEFTFIARPT